MKRRTSQSAAFTLVELLVTIAIMTVMIGMAATWYGRVKEHALRTACASNLNQMGIATVGFYTDWRHMPSFSYGTEKYKDGSFALYIQANKSKTSGWEAYGGDVMVCPKDQSPAMIPIYNRRTNQVEYLPTSYGYNLGFLFDGMGYSTLENPADTVMMFDGSMDLSHGEDEILEYEHIPGNRPSNHGHGNNEDDVDSSNPGGGWRKNKNDSDPNVDDEIRPFKNKHGVGPQTIIGRFEPGTPDQGDVFFIRRHEVNPLMGNVLYADGRVIGLDRAPAGFVDSSEPLPKR